MNDECIDCLCHNNELQCSICDICNKSGLSLEELRAVDYYDGDDYSESLYIPDEDD